jgi:RNA polymerase sigma factor (sigma-70 family)
LAAGEPFPRAADYLSMDRIDATPKAELPDSRADALLAVRCQLGEREAFDDLIRRWAGPLRRHVLRVAGNAELADELVQDIWLRVLQGIGRLQDPEKFRSWLFGIAHRRLMDQLRERYASPIDAQANASLEDIVDETPLEDRALEALELGRGLQRLPTAERDVLSLFYLEELSLNDVASVLAVPVGTVKSRLFRARNLLRLQLIGEDND